MNDAVPDAPGRRIGMLLFVEFVLLFDPTGQVGGQQRLWLGFTGSAP